MNDRELSNRLKEIRQARGFTQEALAEQAGVTRQTIIAIEKSRFVPSVKLALEIAAILGMPVENIFWLEKSKTKD
jgi:putative transcriptional regulator